MKNNPTGPSNYGNGPKTVSGPQARPAPAAKSTPQKSEIMGQFRRVRGWDVPRETTDSNVPDTDRIKGK